jgi:hypothetical protein
MAKKTGNKTSKRKQEVYSGGPWLSMRTGVITIAITSIFMAVLTAWQAIPARGVLEGILLGLLFGGMIWAIFFGFLLLNRFLRR